MVFGSLSTSHPIVYIVEDLPLRGRSSLEIVSRRFPVYIWLKWIVLCMEVHQQPSNLIVSFDRVRLIDLCDTNHVIGYPTLFIYEDGEMLEEYNGNRDLEEMKDFIKRHVKNDENTSVVEVEEPPLPKLNTQGQVLSIPSQAAFFSTLEEGPAFVKFFAPWCGHCKRLAPIWVQLAVHMKDKLTVAEVDCEAHASLCALHRVPGCPTLIYFSSGVRSEYTGGRKLDQLKAFAETALDGRLHPLHGDTELVQYVQEHDVVYLFLYSGSDGAIIVSKFVERMCDPLTIGSKLPVKLLHHSLVPLLCIRHIPRTFSLDMAFPRLLLGQCWLSRITIPTILQVIFMVFPLPLLKL